MIRPPAEHNALNALFQLLKMSNVRVTRRGLTQLLDQHSDFPSMAALSDTLTELNVNNLATNLTANRLADVPLPALAHLQTNGGMFAPIRQITADRIEWFHTDKGWQMERLDNFLANWTGFTLLIEPTEASGERNYSHDRRTEQMARLRVPFIALSLCVCLGLVLGHIAQNIPFALSSPFYQLLLVKTAGLLVSGALI